MRTTEIARRWSPSELYISHMAKGHTEDVIATIDVDAFMALRKNAREKTKTLNNVKYFNLKPYMHEHMRRALSLRLNNAGIKVLDIGTGFGYFPYICEFFGNTAVALDVPDHPLFDDVTNFLNVNKMRQRVETFQPLVGLDRSFDLVTAFQLAFNGHKGKRWGEEEWAFFLDDVFNNVLKQTGELVLEPNYDFKHRFWLSPSEFRAFRRYRTQISGRRIRVKRNSTAAS